MRVFFTAHLLHASACVEEAAGEEDGGWRMECQRLLEGIFLHSFGLDVWCFWAKAPKGALKGHLVLILWQFYCPDVWIPSPLCVWNRWGCNHFNLKVISLSPCRFQSINLKGLNHTGLSLWEQKFTDQWIQGCYPRTRTLVEQKLPSICSVSPGRHANNEQRFTEEINRCGWKQTDRGQAHSQCYLQLCFLLNISTPLIMKLLCSLQEDDSFLIPLSDSWVNHVCQRVLQQRDWKLSFYRLFMIPKFPSLNQSTQKWKIRHHKLQLKWIKSALINIYVSHRDHLTGTDGTAVTKKKQTL